MTVNLETSDTGAQGSWEPLVCEAISNAVPDQDANQIYNWAVMITFYAGLQYIRARYAGLFVTFASRTSPSPQDFEINFMSSSVLTLQ